MVWAEILKNFWAGVAVGSFVGFFLGVIAISIITSSREKETPRPGENGDKKAAKKMTGLSAEQRLIALSIQRVK